MKTGIVMEGGAMRGMFTAGLLDVFMENDIHFDGAVGVSAGVTFGCNLKSHQIGRTLRYNKKYCRDKRYASWESLLRTGDIFNAKFDYEDIPKRLDPFDTDTFLADPMEFWVTATNVDTGEPVYHRLTDGKEADIQWIRASASMPGVSNVVYCRGTALAGSRPWMSAGETPGKSPGRGGILPVRQSPGADDADGCDADAWDGLTAPTAEGQTADGRAGGKYREISCDGLGFSDGGTSDSVPVRFMEDLGYEKIVVICTQPYGYRKQPNRMLPFLRLKLRHYPELLRSIAERHIMYNATMDYLDRTAAEKPEHILLIRPREALGIKQVVHDPDEIQRVYDLGRAEGERVLPRVRQFCSWC